MQGSEETLPAPRGNRHTIRQKICVCPYSLNQWPSSRWMGKVPLVVMRAEYALALLTAAPDGVRAGLTWG